MPDEGMGMNTLNVVEESIYLKDIYKNYESDYKFHLDHYFRNLYRILVFTDKSKLVSTKKYYTNIIRSQLSNYELILIFYYSIASYDSKDLKNMIEKYQILKDLPFEFILNSKHLEMIAGKAITKV